ncbi:MAG: cytochrome c [Pseudomonadota bacterium]
MTLRLLSSWAFAFLSASAMAQDISSNPPSAAEIARGAKIYATNCSSCHGVRMAGPEWAIDLTKFPKDQRVRFIDSVTHGKAAMPPWGDVLKPDEVAALWSYVVAGESK